MMYSDKRHSETNSWEFSVQFVHLNWGSKQEFWLKFDFNEVD